jgi:hypothetical protein
MNKTMESISFAARWRRQAYTGGELINSQLVCDSAVDGDGDYHVYRAVDAASNRTVCTGFNFSEYDELGLTLQSHTGLTYDMMRLSWLRRRWILPFGMD